MPSSSKTDSKTTKLFETSERGKALRLRERTYRGSPRTFVLLDERDVGGWYRVGSVELGYGPIDARGRLSLSNGSVAEWAHTQFHADGDRVRVGRRLRTQFDGDTLEIVLEEEREEVLGFGDREEHDWQPVDRWCFAGPGGEET